MFDNPLLLVCLAIGLGALLGRLAVFRVSLGVAGVLFAGVICGWLRPGVHPPDALATFGLALFVYSIGLSSSEALFDTWANGGWKFLLIPLAAIGVALGVDLALAALLGLSAPTAAGLLAGALTNTPALAAATTSLGARGAEATLAYAITYPLGVLVPILALSWLLRGESHDTGDTLGDAAIKVLGLGSKGETVASVALRLRLSVRFARCIRGAEQFALAGDSVIRNGDIVSVVGAPSDVALALTRLGTRSNDTVMQDYRQLDLRRIFVSNPQIAGRKLRELALHQHHEGTVTRIRRGDRDFIAHAETVLRPGDRLRVIAPRERMAEISAYLGDSYQETSEVNILTFGLGLAMGLALGTVRVSLPTGLGEFEIGPVAGCLIVAMTLGALGRTGSLTWYLPYSASMALRQLGLVVFLACAGIKAGALLHTAPFDASVLLAGLCVTVCAVVTTVAAAHAIGGRSWPFIAGVVGGVQTQPAVLGFAAGRCGHERVEPGYAEAYPLAMLLKIVAVQVVVALLAGSGAGGT